MERQSLAQQVRDALAHLHDLFYLESHPLASELADGGDPLSGAALRQLLLDAIDGLKPRDHPQYSSADWRRYRHLVLRYLDGHSMEQIERELQISARQASRDHQKAIDALATHFALHLSRRKRDAPPGAQDRVPDLRVEIDLELAVHEVAPAACTNADLLEILQGAIRTLQKLARGHHVFFDLNLPDTLSPVAIDPVTLRQLLLHFLTYAIEMKRSGTIRIDAANRPTGISLSVVLESSREVGTRTSASVKTGEGMTDLYEMGRRLLESQGGAVELVSRGSGAAQISIFLPPSRQTTVLVIDDNPDVVELFRRFLRGEPYRLLQATTGATALQLAEAVHPDIIILDVVMPSQDGWDILASLQSALGQEETPVIICSVLAERTLAYTLGAADFLAKPVTRQALLSALERWSPVSRGSRDRL
jgi:CheY-like chemotaxis protein